MYVADFLIDKVVPDSSLRDALATGLGVDANDVGVWPLGQVADRSARYTIQTDNVGGDFPYQVRVQFDGAQARSALMDVVRTLAGRLNSIVVTDDVGVDPTIDDEFLMVIPDGTVQIVQADINALDENMIVLVPGSRDRYEAVRQHNRTLATTT